MSNSGDNGSRGDQPSDVQGQQPADPWAQAPAEPQDPYAQPGETFGGPQAQDPFAQSQADLPSQPAPQDPYAQQPEQEPWGRPPHEQSQDPFAPSSAGSASSASDPYGQTDPYGQQRDPYSQPDPYAPHPDPYGPPAGGVPSSGSSASDPYGQASPGYGEQSPGYGPQSPGYGPAGGAAQAPAGELGQSRLVVGLLGIFLGAFGVHRFLLGYTTIGIIQVCITVLSCGMLSWVSGIWGLVEGILVLSKSEQFLRDAHGRPLAD